MDMGKSNKDMNLCQANHQNHDRKSVKTIIGDMVIFDWEKYMGFNGYCTGQDGVSQTIDTQGYWDIAVQQRISDILEHGKKGTLVMDIGCHIGYFTLFSKQMGYDVWAYDGNEENIEVAKINCPDARYNIIWFGKDNQEVFPSTGREIELVKIDIEGAEQYAITFLSQNMHLIKNIIMEVSPVFNDSYPALIERLCDLGGFEVFEIDGTLFDYDYNFAQKDLWFKKI